MNKIEFLKHSNIREREHLIIILFFSQKICKFKVYQNSNPINEIIILQVPKIKCSCYHSHYERVTACNLQVSKFMS